MLPRFLILAVFLLEVALCPWTALCGEMRKPTESEVKVAYIYNFAKFVEWPYHRFKDGGDTIHVCVLGDDPLGGIIHAINGKSVENRTIRTRGYVSARNMGGCEIIFISQSEEEQLDSIVEAIKDTPVLTISDTKGFTQRGVMINFYMESNRVLFEINPKAAIRSGLKISSALLRIARIVGGP
jgi:hypothetical protein